MSGERGNRGYVSSRFRYALQNASSPETFIETVATTLVNGHDTCLRTWAKMRTEHELQDVINRAIESGCRDGYEFLYFCVHDNSSLPDHTIMPVADLPVTGKQKKETSVLQPVPAIHGRQCEAMVNKLTKIILSSLTSNRRKFVLLTGDAVSGKTTILSEIVNRIQNNSSHAIYNFKEISDKDWAFETYTSCLIVLDDADAFWYPGMEHMLEKSFKNNNAIFLFSCTDAGKFKDLLANIDSIHEAVPRYKPEEVCRILASMHIHTNTIHPDSLTTILNILTNLSVTNLLSSAMDIISILSYDYITTRQEAVSNSVMQFSLHDIRQAISAHTGIQISAITDTIVNDLKTAIAGRIKGQDDAIDLLTPSLATIASAITDPGKPAGVYLFYGPSGCGKSYMANVIADILFNGAVHKEDMSTYSEYHSVSRLTGAPPGYQGYTDTPAIIKFIKNNTRGVILFDEIEKANPVIFDHLMEMFDTGILRDSKGIPYSIHGFLIVLTSNITYGKQTEPVGFSLQTSLVDDIVPRDQLLKTKIFRKEFVARLQSIVRFNVLPPHSRHDIAEAMLDNLVQRLCAIGFSITVDTAYKQQLISDILQSYTDSAGARSMKVYVENDVKLQLVKGVMYE